MKKLIKNNKENFQCYIANDNSNQQIVISGYNKDLDLMSDVLKKIKLKILNLQVSAPFHCKLMEPAKYELKSFR